MNEHDLIKFRLPSGFIIERVRLTGPERAYGYRKGWIGDREAVALVLNSYSRGDVEGESEVELALLLADELERVPQLIEQLDRGQADEPDVAVWHYLVLSWLWLHRFDYTGPLELVEMLYADFDYPDEMADFVRFMPHPASGADENRYLDRNWITYLGKKATLYGSR